MGRLGEFLKKLLLRGPVRAGADAERLRIAFRARYHSFRLLLDANRRALDNMASIDQALRGNRPFDLTWVRGRCTRVATHVWQMIRQLDELAPERYRVLQQRFRRIQDAIRPHIGPSRDAPRGDLIIPLDETIAARAGEVGSKMANLGEMRNRLGLRVPDGFSVTTAGFRRFIEHFDLGSEINRRLQVASRDDPAELYAVTAGIQQLIADADLPDDLARAILERYRHLEDSCGRNIRVAVRSSALGEDAPGASVAGQYHSELNVRGDGLLAAYKKVVASKYGLSAMTYRLQHGLLDEDVAMCVGVLCMVDATAGGVLYSRNPLDTRDEAIIINSAWGLPQPVVEGRVASDLFVVDRGEPPRIRTREISNKPTKFVCDLEQGVCGTAATGDEQSGPSLTDPQVLELAALAVRLEKHYGGAEDVEWAVDRDGRVVLLQSRPLQIVSTTASDAPPGDAKRFGEVLASGRITASSGAAAGRSFVVDKGADARQFPDGAVLVTTQPLPRWANLLSRAGAIVAEYGSVASHLANVAREYRVPALFGVEQAVSRIPTGRIVTVDADRRVVFDGRVEGLTTSPDPRRRMLEGSPVHRALEGAARHITPLHLLDPEAPEFRPERCRTLHDITRFCHEKAVQEMFRFGKDHRFPERSSKQLYCDVAMNWWVLNLDDGFKQEVEGRYVKLDNIASSPMLALWNGITAVPWEGPPPLDGRGFLSVMFGATTNRELNPGMRSRYADRNYFMISRDYCSLSSRLGAHFSIVEALVSDRTSENYVSFQFKGGAADFERRLKRVVFVGEILEEYGFDVEINQDNLIARLEGREEEFMKSRLRILGHLTIHTRQLDMVMARPASVEHYRAKIIRDIDGMLAED